MNMEFSPWILYYSKTFMPAHHSKQFHADYTPIEKIRPYLDKEKLGNWAKLVQLKNINHWNLRSRHLADRLQLTGIGFTVGCSEWPHKRWTVRYGVESLRATCEIDLIAFDLIAFDDLLDLAIFGRSHPDSPQRHKAGHAAVRVYPEREHARTRRCTCGT
jgi:hypothetical protein